ncbi:MAG: RusA family crossover junction endodeoxyribonuclease [Clostridiales bacterium]|nr:RusA family crossover junction endodeoxyribonuclease [Clostridiales bacterium]
MADLVRQFRIHREPKGKQRVRVTRSGHAYTPNDTTTYEGIVRSEYQMQVGDVPPYLGPVVVNIRAYCEIPKSWSKKKQELAKRRCIVPTKKPDCDNIAKMICDALNGLAYKDDAQVAILGVYKDYVGEGEVPHVDVSIHEMNLEE